MQDITTYQLAELVEYQTTTQEVMGSNPDWTNTHSLSRKCCLSNNYICKWLDFLVFSDKDDKP